jgi:hypothetical protein
MLKMQQVPEAIPLAPAGPRGAEDGASFVGEKIGSISSPKPPTKPVGKKVAVMVSPPIWSTSGQVGGQPDQVAQPPDGTLLFVTVWSKLKVSANGRKIYERRITMDLRGRMM